MKKTIIALLALVSMLTLAACGNGEENYDAQKGANEEASETDSTEESSSESAFNYMGNDLSPYITVGNYKGLQVTTESSELTEEEYQEELAALLESYSSTEQITDRAVEAGETVVTSYVGYLDGVAFEGGTDAGATVTAADGNGMIDGFGPAFVGQTPGVEFSFNVSFPTVYGNLDLAGKEVTFVCTIDYIQGDEIIVPELNDEFVQMYFGYETAEEFDSMYREYIAAQKEYSVQNELYTELWSQVVDASVVKGYPAGEVDRSYAECRESYEAYASVYGLEYEDFLNNYIGMTDDDVRLQAEYLVKENLVIYQMVKELGILVDDDRFNEEVEAAAEAYGATTEEIISYYGRDTIMLSILQQEVLAKVAEAAEITETN